MRTVIIDNIRMVTHHGRASIGSFCSSSIASFGGAWSFLPSCIVFRKSLLACLALPVIISNSAAPIDDSASKLSKHGLGSDDGNLARPIRVRKNLLMNQIVLFRLRGNDLVQRSVLVEQQVRVSVSQDSSTFGGQHEELVAPVGHVKGPTSIFSTVGEDAIRCHFLLARLIVLSRDVFVFLGT